MSQTRYHSFQNQFIIILLTVITICGTLCAFFVYRYVNTSMIDIKKSSVLTLHQEKTEQLIDLLSSSAQFVQLIAMRTRVVEYLTDPTIARHDELVTIFDAYPRDSPSYLAVYLLDATGSAVISTDRSFLGKSYAFRRYFSDAMTGKPHVEALLGVTSGEFGYYFSHPVLDEGGKPLGVVVAKLSPIVLEKKVLDPRLLTEGNIMLTDEYGVILLSNKKDRLLKSLGSLTADEQQRVASEQRYGTAAISSIQYELIQQALRKNTSTIIVFEDKEDKEKELISTFPTTPYPFHVVYEIQTSKLEAVSIGVARLIAIAIIVAAGIAVGAIFIFLRVRLKPLTELKRVADAASHGDLSQIVDIHSHDEFQEVGNAFQYMFDRLKAYYATLDARVREQTSVIAEKGASLERQQQALMNILEDVSEEKAHTLVEKVKYESLLNSITDGVIATDSTGKIIIANQGVTKILGFTQEELVGKQFVDAMPIVDEKGVSIPQDERPFALVMKTKKPVVSGIETKFYYVRKDGTYVPLALSTSPVLLQNKFIGIIDVFRDIGHEKNVDRMKNEFISLASHQLRTPLSAMKWFGEMLLDGDAGPLNPEQHDYVDNIYQSNERMISLVNSLLNISRIESGRIIIDPRLTDLRALVGNVVKELQMKLDEKKQTLIVSVHDQLPPIMLDEKLIHEVYKNLLTNAMKYSAEGTEITVFVSKKDDDIVSQVADNWYGIPLAEQPRIFDKFYRGTNILKLETEGTGLGLYLAKSIIDSSGGKMWFTSTEGVGTTFWFSLPMSGMQARKGEVAINA